MFSNKSARYDKNNTAVMKRNKTLYRALLIAGFILLNTGIIYGISQVIAYLNTGADRQNMLHLDISKNSLYIPDVTWQSIKNPGRPLELTTKKKIEKDYLDAWATRNNAFFTGNDTGIFDHFSKNARNKIYDLLTFNKEHDTHIESTTLSHHITLEFYSADGTIVVLTDRNVTGVERIYKHKKFLFERAFNEDYKIILLLEDGFWKIRHFEKIKINDPLPIAESKPLNKKLLEGMNYYPQNSPWDTFGNDFDTKQLQKDFNLLSKLGLHTIRIFIGYEDFGGATVKETKLKKIELLLDEAQRANLKVIVTLFDFYGDYHLLDWTSTNAHINVLTKKLKDHPALLAWDIKNEPDLDFDSRGKFKVLSWLKHSIRYLKEKDPLHPVTIGWSSPENALLLVDEVTIISYHFYQELNKLSSAHKKLTQASSKPVILQEFGMSSYHGFWNPIGNNNQDQADYYKRFFEIQKRDSIHYLSWTLYDFRKIPNRVAGNLPWRKNKQAYFGIIDTLGIKDNAYLIFKDRKIMPQP